MILLVVCLIISNVLVNDVYGLTKRERRFFKADDTYTEHNTQLTGNVTITTNRTAGFHMLFSNGIPDHNTADYPSRGKPHAIVVQNYKYTFPIRPSVANESTSLGKGPIGFAINGIPFYSPWTRDGKDAVTIETFDMCDGHPDAQGRYHYHKMPKSCVFEVKTGVPSFIIGVARDGFPIYGPNDENGDPLTNEDLDACHGRYVGTQYRYHVTDEFPYVIGCYMGEVN